MTIKGGYGFPSRTARFHQAIQRRLVGAQVRAAEAVGDHLVQLIESSPRRVETGAYLRSWREAFASATPRVTPNGPAMDVTSDSPYGPYVEYGTADTPAAMHLPRARMAAEDEAREAVTEALNAAWKGR